LCQNANPASGEPRLRAGPRLRDYPRALGASALLLLDISIRSLEDEFRSQENYCIGVAPIICIYGRSNAPAANQWCNAPAARTRPLGVFIDWSNTPLANHWCNAPAACTRLLHVFIDGATHPQRTNGATRPRSHYVHLLAGISREASSLLGCDFALRVCANAIMAPLQLRLGFMRFMQ
jgi:hypothetical protein